MQMKRILVTTDFSEQARTSYSMAAFLAEQYGAEIYLVHVAEPLPPHFYLTLESVGASLPAGSFYDGLDAKMRAESTNEAFEKHEIHTKILLNAKPQVALLEYIRAKKIDFILVATHGHTGIAHALLGSFTEKLVRLSPVPVLTLRRKKQSAFDSPLQIVVPFDFSDNAKACFPALRTLSSQFKSEFHFVYVLEPSYALYDAYGTGSEIPQDAPTDPAQLAREHFDIVQDEQLQGIKVKFEVVEGTAHVELCRLAREVDADLILMTTHGWTGLDHLFLGSVTEKVVRKAPCSVLTIRPEHHRTTIA